MAANFMAFLSFSFVCFFVALFNSDLNEYYSACAYHLQYHCYISVFPYSSFMLQASPMCFITGHNC